MKIFIEFHQTSNISQNGHQGLVRFRPCPVLRVKAKLFGFHWNVGASYDLNWQPMSAVSICKVIFLDLRLIQKDRLTHWGWVTYLCVGKLAIIGPDNGLSPGRHQVIIWTNFGILLIGILRTNFSGTSIEIYAFSFNKMHLNMSSGKWQLFCLGLNMLTSPSSEKSQDILIPVCGYYEYGLQSHTKWKAMFPVSVYE